MGKYKRYFFPEFASYTLCNTPIFVDASAALYSRKLMHHAFLQLERFDNIDDPYFYHYDDANPMEILQHSYDVSMAEAKREGIVGSTTACIAVLRGDELRIANLGDCGISVIRQNHYAFRSEEQQHFFNFPYQLGTNSTTRPRDAQVWLLNFFGKVREN